MSKPPSRPASTGSAAFDRLLWAGCALLAFQLLGPVLTIPLHIPLNNNEGWNALFDLRAWNPAAGSLYPPAGSLVFNNYPPLGFVLVGAAGRYVFGDMIVAGRVIALAALLSTAALTGLCVCYLGSEVRGGGWRAAGAAGLLLLLYVNSYFKQYVAMDDPQWLAQAFMAGGLALLLCRDGINRLEQGRLPAANLVGSALLMLAGGLVKHNVVALPFAVGLWLVRLNRRAAIIWLATALASLAVAAGVLAWWQGPVAFSDILQHRRLFRAALATRAIGSLAPLAPMATVVAVILGRRDRARDAGVSLVMLFGVIALATGILQRTGEGVYYNAHFETLVALCLGFGLAVSQAFAAPWRWRGWTAGPAILTLFAVLPLVGAWPWHLPRAWADIHSRAARAAAWQPVIDRIAAAHGTAGCAMMSLCWWAGKPSDVDMFNLTQAGLSQEGLSQDGLSQDGRGGGSLARFQALVARRHFAIFEDDPKSFTHKDILQKLGYDPVRAAFANAYQPIADGPGGVVLLVPKPLAKPTTR